MKTKKCARILCLLLCFMFLLVSCGDNDDDTSSEAVESGESVVETVSDKVSRDESSEESSEEPSNDESSEEPSEPDYQVEMTEEMMRAYLELKLVSYPLEHMLANHEENYNYKDDYTAFGNLNGYTLCGICPRITYGSGIPARFPL